MLQYIKAKKIASELTTNVAVIIIQTSLPVMVDPFKSSEKKTCGKSTRLELQSS